MKSPLIHILRFVLAVWLACFFLATCAIGQQTQPPVSYASVQQLNGLLGNLEQTNQTTIGDLSRLRIDKWKTDGNTKRQVSGDVQALLRNLQGAVPGLINELRAAPEDLAVTFKVYHNLDALHDVLRSVAETAGAFAPREEYQPLANDANSMDSVRRALADRVQTLATAKESELGRLRTEVQALQAAVAAAPPKKIVVDDSEAPKKPVKTKKKAARKAQPAQGDQGQKQAPQQPANQQPQSPK
jgi:hypothetical protein